MDYTSEVKGMEWVHAAERLKGLFPLQNPLTTLYFSNWLGVTVL